jgi:hypothetical protein
VLFIDAGAVSRSEQINSRSMYLETDLDTGRCRDLAEFCRKSPNDAMPTELRSPKLAPGTSAPNMALGTEPHVGSRPLSVEGRLMSGHSLESGVPDVGSRSFARPAYDRNQYPQNPMISMQGNDWFSHNRNDVSGLGERGRSDSSHLEAPSVDGRSLGRSQFPSTSIVNEAMRGNKNDFGHVQNFGRNPGVQMADSGNRQLGAGVEDVVPMNVSKSASPGPGWTPSRGTFSMRSGNTFAGAEVNSFSQDREAAVVDTRRSYDRNYSAQVKG